MVLLDTCTLLWLSAPKPILPKKVTEAIRRTLPGERYLSAISIFEIGIKWKKGKLRLPSKPNQWVEASCATRGLTVLPITKEILYRCIHLPGHHNDPADRIIISTALELNVCVLTPDEAFRSYKDVKTLWGS